MVSARVRHRELHSRNTATNEEIEVIEGAGAHAHQNLIAFDTGLRDVFDHQNIRPAMLVNPSGFHLLKTITAPPDTA